MIRLEITVPDINAVLAAGYTIIRVYTDTDPGGAFTTLDGTISLVAGQSGYSYVDLDGTTATWYKTAYYGDDPGESSKSDAFQGGAVIAYCTALDVRQELAIGSGQAAIPATHDHVLWNMVIEASRLIDEYQALEPGAYLAAGSEERSYNGDGGQLLYIDPAVAVTKVEVEESNGVWTEWTLDADYYLWPWNAAAHGEPIRALVITGKSPSTKRYFRPGYKRVRVTGTYGQATTPPGPIARACKIQAARWYKRAAAGWADAAASVELGEVRYVRKLDPEVEVLLKAAWPPGARL